MDNGIFGAGVRPGSPTTQDEIKMLLCFILSRIGLPMSFDQLHESLREHGLVNYFDLVQSVEGLVATGHLQVEESAPDYYAITDVGWEAAVQFTSVLPLSVREKAESAADLVLRRQKRLEEVSVNIEKAQGGYTVELSLPDGQQGSLIRFSLFLPTEEECRLVRRRFLNDPLFIYQGVTALLTGDKDVLGRIFPEQTPLF